MSAHFGEMLLSRRRQLGLSIQQVANTIKIRPQIIEYFENEDFAHMPPRGYAQGMIASYARYLGLNPREVVDAYFDALYQYERSTEGHGAGRYQDSVADVYPRSSNDAGRFLMVNTPSPTSRFASRPQQAGYVSESTSPHEPVSANQLRGSVPRVGHDPRRQGPPRDSARPGMRPSNARPPQGRSSRADGIGQRPRSGQHRPIDGYSQDRMQRASQYRDGRPGRPGGRRPAPQPTYDPRMLLGVGAAGMLIVVLLVFLLIKGCTPKRPEAPQNPAPQAQAAGSSQASDQKNDDAVNDDDTSEEPVDDSSEDQSDENGESSNSSDGDAAGDASSDAPDGEPEEPKPLKVKVSLKNKGAVAWIEVKLDGRSVLASQEVGPFSQEFTVTQQIEITTDKPSDVVVVKDGKKVRYDTKVPGLAKVTIDVPKPPEPKKQEGSEGQDAQDGTTGAQGASTSNSSAAVQ